MEEKEYKKIDRSIWKEIFAFLKPYKKLVILILFLNISIGASEAIFPLFSKYALDNFVAHKTLKGLDKFIFFYILLLAVVLFIRWAYIRSAGRLEISMRTEVKRRAYENLQRLSLSYFDKTPVGWIMARVGSDSYQFTEIISWAFMDIAYGMAILIAYLVAMFSLNWKLALLSCIMVPFIAWISKEFHKRMITVQREVKKVNSEITAAYNEDIQGAKTTKTLVLEDKNYDEFTRITERYRKKALGSQLLSSIYLPLVIGLGSIATSLVLSEGGSMVYVGTITVGTFSAMITYSLQFYEPIRMAGAIFSELLSAQASAERIFNLINEEPKVKDLPEVIQKYGNSFDIKKEDMPGIKGEVEFKNVSFNYTEDEEVLKDFSLKINPGETLALVGETGSGKSTIVNLFLRFYEPLEGQILIDGVDYKNMPIAWIHKNTGYVLQTPELFSGTIFENIAYGKEDATREEVENAAKLVDAHDFIMETEKGYDTEVGEGGSRLSVGQKQLISFARALIRNPALIVLDEATSSVDTETEKKIQEAVWKTLSGRTSIVVAHRLSTIRNADKILVLHHGKIIEQGSHKELMKNKGNYYNLYKKQFIEDRERDWETGISVD